MFDFSTARTNMVDCQIRTAGVVGSAILQAFETTPREKFIPQNLRSIAYTDENLPLGEGRFLMAPVIHARMIQAAEPRPGDVALDIGGANGYPAAILSSMVTTVIALEDKQKYLTQAKSLWDELEVCNVAGFKGKLTSGSPENGPYDIIFMNGAVAEIPVRMVEQLAPEGRLVTIVKKPGAVLGQVTLVRSLGGKQFSSYTLFEAGMPYLSGFEPVPAFNF